MPYFYIPLKPSRTTSPSPDSLSSPPSTSTFRATNEADEPGPDTRKQPTDTDTELKVQSHPLTRTLLQHIYDRAHAHGLFQSDSTSSALITSLSRYIVEHPGMTLLALSFGTGAGLASARGRGTPHILYSASLPLTSRPRLSFPAMRHLNNSAAVRASNVPASQAPSQEAMQIAHSLRSAILQLQANRDRKLEKAKNGEEMNAFEQEKMIERITDHLKGHAFENVESDGLSPGFDLPDTLTDQMMGRGVSDERFAQILGGTVDKLSVSERGQVNRVFEDLTEKVIVQTKPVSDLAAAPDIADRASPEAELVSQLHHQTIESNEEPRDVDEAAEPKVDFESKGWRNMSFQLINPDKKELEGLTGDVEAVVLLAEHVRDEHTGQMRAHEPAVVAVDLWVEDGIPQEMEFQGFGFIVKPEGNRFRLSEMLEAEDMGASEAEELDEETDASIERVQNTFEQVASLFNSATPDSHFETKAIDAHLASARKRGVFDQFAWEVSASELEKLLEEVEVEEVEFFLDRPMGEREGNKQDWMVRVALDKNDTTRCFEFSATVQFVGLPYKFIKDDYEIWVGPQDDGTLRMTIIE